MTEWNAEITVVGGAGHVGLPLALAFADIGRRVLIHDIDDKALKTIAGGRLPFVEYGGQALLDKALGEDKLRFSASVDDVPAGGVMVVTIGTPIDEFLNPEYEAVSECIDNLLSKMTDDCLVILRSTVFPGTTDWLHRHLRTRGKSPKLAFCPERVVQGHATQELRKVPQIVSGTTPEAEDEAAELFAGIGPAIVRLTPQEAEFAKLFSNTYRYIHFAVTNELYMIAENAGVDYHRVLDGMTQDYPRAQYIPRPGFAAGPCLFKDTMQLSAFANNRFGLGHAAMLVNEGLVLYVVDEARRKYPLAEMTVGLLGMAFKADVDDTRASLSYKMKNALKAHAKEVLTTDPHVTSDAEIKPLDEVIAKSDLLVLCTPHGAYKDLDVGETPLIDIWRYIGSGRI